MSRHSCCTILVWVLLQLIFFSPILTNCTKSLVHVGYCKQFCPEVEINFTQNLQYKLIQQSKDGNEWGTSHFSRKYVKKGEPVSYLLLRNIANATEVDVQKKILLLTLSSKAFQNVNNEENPIQKLKIVFSFNRNRKYIIALNNTLTIRRIKLTIISKCSNLLAEQVTKEGTMVIAISRNSRFSGTMQLFCMINNCYAWTYKFRYEPISNSQNTPIIFLWIPNCDIVTDYFRGFIWNFIFKGSWNVNRQIFYDNRSKANLPRTPKMANSYFRSCNNWNFNNRYFKHIIYRLKKSPKVLNGNSFAETNSRKNRLLLSVNSATDLDEETRGIGPSQKARYTRNKKVPSMNNQRDSSNGNRYASKVERRRRKRKSRRLAKDLTFATETKRATSSSEEADTRKSAVRISFSRNNEADYRREIERQIETDFAKIKDTLRLEKANVISREIPQWHLNAAKNNRQSISQLSIDTQQPEIITGKPVCIAPHCQQVIRQGLRAKSPDSNELPANSRGSVTSEQNEIAAVVTPRKVVTEKIQPGNDDRKLVGEALIILNKDASPFTILQKLNNNDVNLKYTVETISLGLDELVKMSKQAMKKELDNSKQDETKKAGLSCKNFLKYAKGNNESYLGLEDDEGPKLEEQLKELPDLHIQREQGFTNSEKKDMRFAAGDEYTFKNDETARLKNEYFPAGHVRRAKKRCRHRKHKSSRKWNTFDKNSSIMQNGIPNREKIKKDSQKLSNNLPFSDTLFKGVTKKSGRIKKNNPYREYKESSAEEKLLSDKKVVKYSRKKRKTSRETKLPSNDKEVSERTIQNPRGSLVKTHKSSSSFNIPRKLATIRSQKVVEKNKCIKQRSSMTNSAIKLQSQIKKKNTLPQSFLNRKLKSVEAVGMRIVTSKSDTLSRDINNYYDYYDPEMPTDSFDQADENWSMRTNASRRKLLSSNSMEYNEGSPISANEESNYDYVEKFYGDQPYEEGLLRLHYFQINLRNVTLLANARMELEASRIELAQFNANKSMKTASANHKAVSKTWHPKRTLKSIAQEENSDYSDKKDSIKNFYLSGDLIGYDYDPEESDSKEKFKREIDVNEDPDLARLFANGQEYDINVRGKLHLRLKDSESNVEKSSKKKRSARPKIEKTQKKFAQAKRKFAVADKRTKRNFDEDSTDVHKADGNLKSKDSNKMKNPLKKISDFFKRKFAGGGKKKEFRKKIHAKAKIVRLKPGQGEDNSQSTFPPSLDQSSTTLESRRGNCKCAHETSTTLASEFATMATDTSETRDYSTQSTEAHESITENNDPNYEVYSHICHCREKSTETSPIITHVTQQYATNQPETDCSCTKAQLCHEIVSKGSPEMITTTSVISTNVRTEKTAVIPSNRDNSENSPEEKAKMKNVLEILNFIKNLEKLLKGKKVPLRIGDENGGVEIKLEKIYLHSGKNQSNVELKDVSEADQKEDMSDVGDTSEVIRQSDINNNEKPISPTRIQSLSNVHSKFLSAANIRNDLKENNIDESSKTIIKPKNYNNAIVETYIEASVPKSSQADKNASNNKSLPAKQWIDEQRIASDNQSSWRSRGSTSSDRKRKKRRRKKKRRRLRKRTVNETGILTKKGKAPYRLRRRRRFSRT